MKPPNIWSNELSKAQDRDIIYQGIQKILKLSNAPALREKYDMKLIDNTAEKCKNLGKPVQSNKKYWDCQIRYKTRPENHQAGTCMMGAADGMAVVDPKLRVHNMKGLRVADASIMPQVIALMPTLIPDIRSGLRVPPAWTIRGCTRELVCDVALRNFADKFPTQATRNASSRPREGAN